MKINSCIFTAGQWLTATVLLVTLSYTYNSQTPSWSKPVLQYNANRKERPSYTALNSRMLQGLPITTRKFEDHDSRQFSVYVQRNYMLSVCPTWRQKRPTLPPECTPSLDVFSVQLHTRTASTTIVKQQSVLLLYRASRRVDKMKHPSYS